jgi:hypothetical protein
MNSAGNSRSDCLRDSVHPWKAESGYCNSQEANDFGCWTQENRSCSEGAMGKDQGQQEMSQ